MDQEELIFKMTGLLPSLYKRRSGQRFRNPFRSDNKPGCFFDYDRDPKYILLADFGNELHNMNVYDMASCIISGRRVNNKQDWINAKRYLESNFEVETKEFVNEYYEEKKYQTIPVGFEKRSWNEEDKIYWNKYEIQIQQLKKDLVVPIKGYTMTYPVYEKKVEFNDIGYFFGFSSGNGKIYRPTLGKEERKWDGYTTEQDVYFDKNESDDFIFLVEGYKDARVVRNADFTSKGLQSTTIYAEQIKLKEWSVNCNYLVFMFDPGPAGLMGSINGCKKCKALGIENSRIGRLPNYVKDDISEYKSKGGDVKKEIEYVIKNLYKYEDFM